MEENKNENLPATQVAAMGMGELLLQGDLFDFLCDRTKNMMWSMVQYKEMQMMYSCALREIQTKFEILSTEFELKYRRNPISSITTRLKRSDSILDKLQRLHKPLNLSSVEENLHDIAGIRVICSYIDDIYLIADALLAQDDITLLARKDYIENPKPNGYRSLHLIVKVPVFFAEQKKEMKVEVQIRTIAMDFWASLEHQLKYKKELAEQEELVNQLKECADVINKTDRHMLEIRQRMEANEAPMTEEEILLEKLGRIDIPIC